MSRKLTRAAYQRLIDKDIAELRKLPETLERRHIEDVLRASVASEYDERPTRAEFDAMERALVRSNVEALEHVSCPSPAERAADVERARAEEREECAKVVDALTTRPDGCGELGRTTIVALAGRVRARGAK